jgi:hypothetical protein
MHIQDTRRTYVLYLKRISFNPDFSPAEVDDIMSMRNPGWTGQFYIAGNNVRITHIDKESTSFLISWEC